MYDHITYVGAALQSADGFAPTIALAAPAVSAESDLELFLLHITNSTFPNRTTHDVCVYAGVHFAHFAPTQAARTAAALRIGPT
jgi:hypothetical protein